MAPPVASSTLAYRVKALYLCVRALRGSVELESFVEQAQLGRAFDDETRPISRQLWVRALEAFAGACGDEGFEQLPRYLVHPNNLGFWSPLLRGADEPGNIYAQLADGIGDLEQLSEWRQELRTNSSFRASIALPEQGREVRRVLRQALRAELAAVPLLLGAAPAEVRDEEERDGRYHATAHFGPPGGRARVLVTVGIGAGAIVCGLAGVNSGFPPTWSLIAAAGGGAISGTVAWLLGREATHRADALRQKTRILALEREARVRREQTSEISASRQDSLIAGQYQVGEQLGVGGASAVWEAVRLSDGEPVAIKLLRTSMASDSRASDRLQREAEALGLTWHPHVVKVHDHGMLPSGLSFLVMERLRGETLSARVRRLRKLEPREVAHWGLQASEALRAVHQAGIVHRDVKPANLFIHREAGREVLKLFDFGIAHVNWAETRLTRDGGSIGTPGYAAPEQEDGGASDPRSDLYSLGVSLHELLTGEGPSAHGSAPRLRTSSHPPDASAPALGELAEGLHQLISELTQLDRDSRPADALAVASRLRNLLHRAEGAPNEDVSGDPHQVA